MADRTKTDPSASEDRHQELTAAVRAEARDGRIACAAALALAERTGVSPAEVGRTCDLLKIKIAACQLGCFGRKDGLE
jgi:hypothetical protein